MFVFTLADMIGVIALTIVFLIWLVVSVGRWMEKRHCKHKQFFETNACNAVCVKCGKNLGFIKISREQPDRTEV